MSTEEQNEEIPDALELETDSPEVSQELSLEQLSQAYAQVMREQGHLEDEPEIESPHGSQDRDSTQPSEPAKRKRITLEEIDNLDNEGCPISPQSIVEAILFVGAPSGVKLSARKIASVIRDVSPKEIQKIVKELNRGYLKARTAYEIVFDNGNYQMQLRDELGDLQNQFFGRNRPAKLNQNAIDVLAVVAYHQPVSKSQVDKIRMKPSGSVLGQLVRRELVLTDPKDKSKEVLYRTTDRFLELFGLGSLDDLPQTSAVSDLEELSDS
ncbi:MAG: SMC-Scp complex subunit ScpB [Planctomycetota bacterium]